MKKVIALALSLALSLGMLAGCGGKSGGGGSDNSNVPSYASLNVGADHTDLKAELRVITHRTDLVDTTFAGYVAEFNKLYPNIPPFLKDCCTARCRAALSVYCTAKRRAGWYPPFFSGKQI